VSSPDETGDATLSTGANGRSGSSSPREASDASGAPGARHDRDPTAGAPLAPAIPRGLHETLASGGAASPFAPSAPSASSPPKPHTVPPATTPSPGGDAGPATTSEPPRITPKAVPFAIATTLFGTGPSPIVPRRRTPGTGTVAPVLPKVVPAAGVPPAPPVDARPEAAPTPIDMVALPPVAGIVPPVIRIPRGGMLGPSTPQNGIRSGSFLCEILLRNGSVTQDSVDRAIAIQEERGGQIGRILVSIGACTEDAIARALIDQLKLRKDSGESGAPDVSVAARENKDVAGLKVLTRPELTVATLLLTDLFSLSLAALLATSVHWLRTYAELGFDLSAWLVVGPAMGLCVLTFLGLELYSPMAKSTPDEIRDVVFASSLVHLGASLLATLGDLPIVRWGALVRSTWWLATLVLVPIFRSLVRNWLCVQPWWGIPVCVLGAAKTGRLIVRTLKAQPRSGLKPVMLLDDDPAKHGTLRASFSNEKMDVYSVNVSAAHFMSESQRKALAEDLFGSDDDELSGPISSDHIPLPPSSWSSRSVNEKISDSDEKQFLGPESTLKPSKRTVKDASVYPRGKFAEVEGVPVVGDLALAPILAQRLKIPYAVLAMPGVDSAKLLQIVERVGGKFSHLLVIPDLFGFATLGVPAKNLGGILGVEVRQQLLLPGPRLAKRIMDVALTGIGSLFVLPFLLVIALLIKLDSKGSIFYTQNRLGRDGEFFKAYKFRTMHGDGEARLKAILDADPQLRAEYEIYHKLRKDPRVTRIGRVLRKFSLDEFPQLLNVIKGDMSLVGPRPYIERELTEMNGQEKIILRAPPGMTGMWQVSDRNATSFAQRVQIDVYYTRNWSPWLDIHILAKTFGVVVKGSGV
jgi:lipopolysaccharide/colanic/teichoic acid biosynthesis glycosyltransferase